MTVPPVPDLDVPSSARISDFMLGGLDNYQADRDLAAQIERMCPGVRQIVLSGREFLARAVTWAAGQDVAQFVDLGCGFPVAAEWRAEHRLGSRRADADTHVSARAVNPAAAVAYVDHDPVFRHRAGHLLEAAGPGIAAVGADLRDPAAVLADPGLLKVIDPAQPACVILGLVLHYMTAARARDLVAGYVRALAAGSAIVISVPRFDDPVMFAAVRDAYTPARIRNFTRGQVISFFAGLDLVRPGVAPAAGLRPGWGDAPLTHGPAYLLAGIGRKVPG